MTIRAQKTAKKNDGREFDERVAPLFIEVKAALEDLRPTTGGEEFVLPEDVRMHPNAGTKIRRAAVAADLSIPKILMNLRATRATELDRVFPSHVVNAWCGHSERIAQKHYRMVLDEDHVRATTKSLAHILAQAGTHVAQSEDVTSCQDSSETSDGRGKAMARPTGTRDDDAGRRGRLVPTGLEPVTFRM